MTYCGPPRHPSVTTLCRVVSLRIAKQVEVNLAWLRNGGWHVAQAQFTAVIHLPLGSPPKQAIIEVLILLNIKRNHDVIVVQVYVVDSGDCGASFALV